MSSASPGGAETARVTPSWWEAFASGVLINRTFLKTSLPQNFPDGCGVWGGIPRVCPQRLTGEVQSSPCLIAFQCSGPPSQGGSELFVTSWRIIAFGGGARWGENWQRRRIPASGGTNAYMSNPSFQPSTGETTYAVHRSQRFTALLTPNV